MRENTDQNNSEYGHFLRSMVERDKIKIINNDKNLHFVDNGNTNRSMLNKSGLHLNEHGITQLLNNFCHTMEK